MNNNRLTENAIIKLNDIALTIHHNDFKLRHNRLVNRLTGDRMISSIWRKKITRLIRYNMKG